MPEPASPDLHGPLSIEEAPRALTAPGAPFEMEERGIRGVRVRTWKNAPPSLRDLFQMTKVYGARLHRL